MTITLTLSAEETDVLAAIVAAENSAITAANAQPDAVTRPLLTPESYMTQRMSHVLASYVRIAYDASVKRMGQGFAAMDYETRKATIAALEAQLN